MADTGESPSVERMMVLGQALGLHQDFLRDVAVRRQEAIIDRAQSVDTTGAHARMLALVQRVAIYTEERIMAQEPGSPKELLTAIGSFAQNLGIQPAEAVELVGPVLEIYQRASQLLARGGNEQRIREDVRPDEGTAAATAATMGK